MMYKIFFYYFLASGGCLLHSSINTLPNLFNKDTLHKIKEINQYLLAEGFTQHWITTADAHRLDALFLQRNNAQFTIIICNGLCCPKESMSTLYHLLPSNCNILFFDARGHGKSSGSLIKTPWKYGIDDYKDILATIDFAQLKTQAPIVLYGSCAGGFNAAHALLYLNQQDMLAKSGVKGFIYDSGWASRIETFKSAGKAKIDKIVTQITRKFISKDNQKRLAHLPAVRTLKLLSNYFINTISTHIVTPLLIKDETKNNLYDKIGTLPIPIFFIHSVDDTWIPFTHAQKLAANAHYPQAWWIIEPSLHSCHHLIHKETYRQKVTDFCSSLFTE